MRLVDIADTVGLLRAFTTAAGANVIRTLTFEDNLGFKENDANA